MPGKKIDEEKFGDLDLKFNKTEKNFEAAFNILNELGCKIPEKYLGEKKN